MAVSQELIARFKADTANFNKKVTEVNQHIQKTSNSVDKLSEKQVKLTEKNQNLTNSNLNLSTSTKKVNKTTLESVGVSQKAIIETVKLTEKNQNLTNSNLNLATSTRKANKATLESVGVSQKAITQADKVTEKTKEQSNIMSIMSSREAMFITATATAITASGVALTSYSVAVGSAMETATKRIESMLGSVEKANFVMSNLREVAYDTGTPIIDLADSYGKLATFVENGSVSLQESIDLQKGLTNTAMALGADSQQLSTVMYGLSQALGSGVVRAEEFNQVTEPLPGIINRMEQATGLASGELRKMVNEGVVTSEMFKNILIPALQSFEKQSEKMADTLKVQSGKLSNTFVAIGEDIYDNLNTPMAGFISLIDTALQKFVSFERKSKAGLETLSDDISFSERLGKAFGFDNIISDEDKLKIGLAREEIFKKIMPLPTLESLKSADAENNLKAEIQKLKEELKKPSKPIVRSSARSNRFTAPRKIEQTREDPLFKEEIRDYKKDIGNFSIDAVSEFNYIDSIFGEMKDNIISGFVTMSSSGKASFKDMARSIIGDIQSIITRALVMKAITGIGNAIGGYFGGSGGVVATSSSVGFGAHGISGFLSGARANGGAVQANKSYLVGERGPEILTMGSNSGYVHSNEKSFGGGGSMIVNIDARGASNGVEQDIRKVMHEVITLKKQVPNIAISAVREQNSRNSGFLR